MNDSPSALPPEVVEEHQRYLWGISYRMTGVAADADEIVQETFARAIERPPADLSRPWRPWLARVALNLCRDRLRQRRRTAYVGPWLPSPVETPLAGEATEEREAPDARYDRMESVTMAFLCALEELTPQQRAVLLLRDVYDYSVRETAEALELSQPNVKVVHHRARRAMGSYEAARPALDAQTNARRLEALQRFLAAVAAEDVAGATAALAEDAVAVTDGGGEYLAALRPVEGADRVARFVFGTTRKGGSDFDFELRELNGLPAVVAVRRGAPSRIAREVVLQVDVDPSGRITRLHSVLAPRKLTAVF